MGYRYVVFGLLVESDVELPLPGSISAGMAELSIHRETGPYSGPVGSVLLEEAATEPRPPGSLRAASCDDGLLLRYEDEIELLVAPRSITCYAGRRAAGPPEPWAVALYVLGPALSVLLEERGMPALHGSAVALAGRALVFLSSSGGGKSTLAASLVGAGMPLMADDIVAVEEAQGSFSARASYPQMRLWPEDARLLLGDRAEELPLVHPKHAKRRMSVGPGGFGRFQGSSLPIGAVYLLERKPRGAPCLIEPLGAGQGIIELVRHSFAAPLLDKLGLQAARLSCFARMSASVPLRRLSYPSGRENLEGVRAAVLADLER